VELNTFGYLTGNTLFRAAIGGIESIVIAIRATPRCKGAIPVRAGEAGIDAQLLDAPAKLLF
jgi:hypothetical protein